MLPDKSYAGQDTFDNFKLNSLKECVDAAVSATSATPGVDQLFWTYLLEAKLCNLKYSKSDIRTSPDKSAIISGSSDCGYQPPHSGPETGRLIREACRYQN